MLLVTSTVIGERTHSFEAEANLRGNDRKTAPTINVLHHQTFKRSNNPGPRANVSGHVS